MEKRYKIKEEVKKYVDDDYHFRKGTLEWWENNCFTLEALEEVEEKIVILYEPTHRVIHKKDLLEFSEQERELIEFVVNNFDSVEMLDCYSYTYALKCNEIEEYPKFTVWLKQRKH